VPQISSDIRNLTAEPFPSSTCELPSAAGAEPLRPLNYNPSGAFPHNKAISSVPILPSCSTGSLEGFTPEPDLQHDLTRCTGSDSNIQSVLGSPIWPESLSQKTLSESAIVTELFMPLPLCLPTPQALLHPTARFPGLPQTRPVYLLMGKFPLKQTSKRVTGPCRKHLCLRLLKAPKSAGQETI